VSGFSIREQIEHMDEDVMRDVAARRSSQRLPWFSSVASSPNEPEYFACEERRPGPSEQVNGRGAMLESGPPPGPMATQLWLICACKSYRSLNEASGPASWNSGGGAV
jgi:hypothetical protein